MLARLTVSTSVVEPRSTASRAPRAVCSPDRTTGPERPSRNSCFSARCWNGDSCHDCQRPCLDRDVERRGGQVVVLGVERARRRRQPQDAPQIAALAGDGRRHAAEVLVELLALDGVALLADAL